MSKDEWDIYGTPRSMNSDVEGTHPRSCSIAYQMILVELEFGNFRFSVCCAVVMSHKMAKQLSTATTPLCFGFF